MGKVKHLVEDVREHISDLFYDNDALSLEEVKQTLRNYYFFVDKTNGYFIDENLVEEIYNEQTEVQI